MFPESPVLKQAPFTIPDRKLTAIVGDFRLRQVYHLNLIAKYL